MTTRMAYNLRCKINERDDEFEFKGSILMNKKEQRTK
jgi:hypothetical protein